MRKSIRRILSSVLTASMLLSSVTVGNVASVFAATGSVETTLPVTVDASNVPLKFDQALTGGEVKISTKFSINDQFGGSGAIITLQYATADGGTKDSTAKFRLNSTKTGEIVLDAERTLVFGNLALSSENTMDFVVDTNTGKFSASVNGSEMATSDACVDANLTAGVAGIKFSAKSPRVITITDVTYSTSGDSVETTTEATTAEATTEATTVEATTEATTNAPVVSGDISIKPEYKLNGDEMVVDYKVTAGAGAGFNNYTLYVTYDPAVLTPVSATDGDITLTVKDATGKDIQLVASNAETINSQIAAQGSTGKVKIAYCVFDKDFSLASGSLPSFTTGGTLFSITYKVTGEVKGGTLGVDAETLNAVSSDKTVQSTPNVTEEDTIIEETPETPDKPVVTDLAITGEEVEAVDGKATVRFNLTNNTAGITNYTVFVKYDPANIKAVSGTADNFKYNTNVVNEQIAYVPVATDTDYPGADGVKTAAELGVLKIAGISETAVTGDVEAFAIDFEVVNPSENGEYPVELTVVAVGDADAQIINCGAVNGLIKVDAVETSTETTTETSTETTTIVTDTTTETTTRRPSSGGGGGGGGGGSVKVTTTTEATTEAVTEDSTEATTNVLVAGEGNELILVTPNGTISLTIPTEKIDGFEGFNDLGNYPWASDSINKLAELGIINGIGNGAYGPGLQCRRADFVILVNRTLGIKVNDLSKNFIDNVDTSKYYYNDVKVGYNAGIIHGYGDDTFKPEQYCTREEMAVMVANTFVWLGGNLDSVDVSINDRYTDVEDIAFWSAKHIAFLTDAGILKGNADGTLLPKNYINRAEMAVMMSRVYDIALAISDKIHAEATTEETTVDGTTVEGSTETTTLEATTTETTTIEETTTVETTVDASTETTTVAE